MGNSQLKTAYDMLHQKITNGELAPGSQLVNRTISKELGVSTIPVREAIHRLTSEGVVHHVPNAGAFVRKLNREEIIQLYDLRNTLELFILERAIEKIDHLQVKSLFKICDEWKVLIDSISEDEIKFLKDEDYCKWVGLDIKYHDILTEAANNVWVKRTSDQLRLMSCIIQTKPYEISEYDATITWENHLDMVKAIEAKDFDKASAEMKLHNTRSVETSLKHYESLQNIE